MNTSTRLLCLLLLVASPSWGLAAPDSHPDAKGLATPYNPQSTGLGQAAQYGPLDAGEDEIHLLEDTLLPFDEFKRRVEQLALKKSNFSAPLQARIAQLQCWALTTRDPDEFQSGITFAEQQLALAQDRGDLLSKAAFMVCRSWLEQRQGKSDEAKQGYEQALQMAETLGDIRLQSKTHGYLGEMYSAQGNLLEAMRHLQASLDLYKSIGLESWHLRQQISVANTYRQMGIYEQAEVLFKELSNTYQARNEVERLNEIHIYQGLLYAEINENGKAIELFGEAEHYFEVKQRPREVAEIRLLWVHALLGLGRTQAAFAKLEQVNERIASGERLEPRLLALRDVLMGVAMEKTGNYQLALNHLNEAIRVLQNVGYQKVLAYAYQTKSQALKQLGLYQSSLQALELFVETNQQVEELFRDRRIMQVQLERELAHQEMENERLENERKLQQQETRLSLERRQWQILVTVLLLGGLLFYLFKRMRALRTLSMTDELTKIRNRRQIMMQAQAMLQQAQQNRTPFSLLVLDVDHFKRVNDTLGHNMGDMVLIEVAQCVTGTLRGQDMVGRNGGEEFLVLLPDTDTVAAAKVAERIRAQVAALEIEGVTNVLDIQVSIGGAQYLPADNHLSALVHRADIAMYQAKQQGRNRVVMAS